MWKIQKKRIKANIIPFAMIGLIVGGFIGFANQLKELSWLNGYLRYANITMDFSDLGSSVMFEHLAPNTLVVLLIAIFLFSALRRILFGALEAAPTEQSGIVFALENFASLLAIAWLGIMFGLLVPALAFSGWKAMAGFALLMLYAAIYLIEVSAATMLTHLQLISKLPIFTHERGRWKMKTRLEGIVILAIGFAALTYHKQLDEFNRALGICLFSPARCLSDLL